MDSFGFRDGSISKLLESRHIEFGRDYARGLQMHSSLIRRLSLEKEMEGHESCVNSIAWNSNGSLLISGSDDTRVNIWDYSSRKLLHSIDTGHSANIFCTKFIPETSDELVVSGAGDAEVRVFNLSRLSDIGSIENQTNPTAMFQCHTRRVKKLAVEVGNPNVVWSASEDGTLRQHDLREGGSCPPAGTPHHECRNILLDLQCGAKRSLAEPPKHALALKSLDISTTRPHLLIVGGSDAFARLYDRRMLPPLSSSRIKTSPPPCVNYFCPLHLSDRGRSSLHLTHVAFSPDGEEVLVSYSGEHVYLFNVDDAHDSDMQYTSGDAARMFSFTHTIDEIKRDRPVVNVLRNDLPEKNNVATMNEKCKKLFEIAENCLKEETNYYDGVEACNEVLDGHGHEIGTYTKHEYLCLRAGLLLKRKWKGDVHMAIRDCYNARKIYNTSFKAFFYMAEALSELGKYKEALDYALTAKAVEPNNSVVAERVKDIKRHIAAEIEKNNSASDGGQRSGRLAGRVLSLGDILHRSGIRAFSRENQRTETEDSDYEEEVELEFETSSLGDEGRDAEPDVHGSVNLRFHRRNETGREPGSTNDSLELPYASSQYGTLSCRPEAAVDMKQRFVGHCNVGTDIKQASFLGQKGEFVASGSDNGRWFIWEKKTGRLIKMLLGDKSVVNCVQCHPYDCTVATSGIDETIKIWTPTASVPSNVAGGAAGPESGNILDAMESNQRELSRHRVAILPLEFLEQFRMQAFEEDTQRFECPQS